MKIILKLAVIFSITASTCFAQSILSPGPSWSILLHYNDTVYSGKNFRVVEEWSTSCGHFYILGLTGKQFSLFCKEVSSSKTKAVREIKEIKLPFDNPYNFWIPNNMFQIVDGQHFSFIFDGLKTSEKAYFVYNCATGEWGL